MTAPEPYVACALRGQLVDGKPVWSAINDDAHTPFGVLGVDALADRVRVYHDTVEAIASCTATADETLAAHRITAGASAGLSYVDVFLARSDTGARVAPADACLPYANVWLHATGYPPAWF